MKKAINYILYFCAILYIPFLLILPIFTDQTGSFFVFNYWTLLLIFFLLSIHYLCVFLEIGFTLLRLLEKKERSIGEKILNAASAVLCVGLIVMMFVEPEFNNVTIVLSSIVVLVWIIGDIIFKQKKFTPEIFRKKSFWISAAAIFAAACLLFTVSSGKLGSKNKPDPLEPAGIEATE